MWVPEWKSRTSFEIPYGYLEGNYRYKVGAMAKTHVAGFRDFPDLKLVQGDIITIKGTFENLTSDGYVCIKGDIIDKRYE